MAPTPFRNQATEASVWRSGRAGHTVDTVFVDSIEFYGYHGASDAEQDVGHRYMVDVALSLDTRRAGRTDSLADTVNYSHVAKRIVAIGTEARYRLLEALASRFAEALLAEFDVEAVRLRVRKVAPPMNVIAAAAGVDIERRRGESA